MTFHDIIRSLGIKAPRRIGLSVSARRPTRIARKEQRHSRGTEGGTRGARRRPHARGVEHGCASALGGQLARWACRGSCAPRGTFAGPRRRGHPKRCALAAGREWTQLCPRPSAEHERERRPSEHDGGAASRARISRLVTLAGGDAAGDALHAPGRHARQHGRAEPLGRRGLAWRRRSRGGELVARHVRPAASDVGHLRIRCAAFDFWQRCQPLR